MKRLWSVVILLSALSALVGVMKLVEESTKQTVRSPAASAPAVIPANPTDYQGSDIEIEGNLAFVSGQLSRELWAQIVIFDISNPLSPKQLSVIPGSQDGYWRDTEAWADIDVVGDRLYAFETHYTWERQGVLHIFDISNPNQPLEISRNDGFGFPRIVKASINNRYLHLRSSPLDSGIVIYDISDPSRHIMLGNYANNDCYPIDYKITDKYSYVMIYDYCKTGQGKTSMIVYDISNAQQPIIASNQLLEELTIDTFDFDVIDNLLYIAKNMANRCHINIIDIGQPNQPIMLGEIDVCVNQIKAKDNFIYDLSSLIEDIPSIEFSIYDASKTEDIQITDRYRSYFDQGDTEVIHMFDVSDNCVIGIPTTVNLRSYCQANAMAIPPSPTATLAPLFTSTPSATPTVVTPTSTLAPTNTPTQTSTATQFVMTHTPTATQTAAPTVTLTQTPIATFAPLQVYVPLLKR